MEHIPPHRVPGTSGNQADISLQD